MAISGSVAVWFKSGTNHRGTENTEENNTEKTNSLVRMRHKFGTNDFVFSVYSSSVFSVPLWFVPLLNQTAAPLNFRYHFSWRAVCGGNGRGAICPLCAARRRVLDVGAGHRRPVGADPLHQSLINDHRGVSHKANMRRALRRLTAAADAAQLEVEPMEFQPPDDLAVRFRLDRRKRRIA